MVGSPAGCRAGRRRGSPSLCSHNAKPNLPLLDPWFRHITLTCPMISGYSFSLQLPAVLRSAFPEKRLQATKGLRWICTFAVLNAQRTPFPMLSPITAHKPGASTRPSLCPSFLTCYQHHQLLPNSCSRDKPCRLCQQHPPRPACPAVHGFRMSITFLHPFRTTGNGSSSSTQLGRHAPGWQHPVPTMPGKADVGCPGIDGCSGGRDSRPPTSVSPHFSKCHKYQFLRNLHPSTQAGNPASICLRCSCA